MRFGIGEQVRPGLQFPGAPGGDHLYVGVERVIAQFKADLVVALSCRAVRHRIGAGLGSNLDLLARDQRASDRRSKEVGALVERIGAEHWKDVVTDEGFPEVLDPDVANSHLLRLGAGPLHALVAEVS